MLQSSANYHTQGVQRENKESVQRSVSVLNDGENSDTDLKKQKNYFKAEREQKNKYLNEKKDKSLSQILPSEALTVDKIHENA